MSKTPSLTQRYRYKILSWFIELLNGIATLSLGSVSMHTRRPHKYVYKDTYPYENHTIIPRETISFFGKYSGILAAVVINIVNSIYVFRSRVNKDVKLWVKFVVVFANAAFLLIAAFIPSYLLTPIEHNLYTVNEYYGVWQNKRKTKKITQLFLLTQTHLSKDIV